MKILAENSVLIIGILGALAFAVSLITELLKDLPGIKKMPTKAFVILVSLYAMIRVCSFGIYGGHSANACYFPMYGCLCCRRGLIDRSPYGSTDSQGKGRCKRLQGNGGKPQRHTPVSLHIAGRKRRLRLGQCGACILPHYAIF